MQSDSNHAAPNEALAVGQSQTDRKRKPEGAIVDIRSILGLTGSLLLFFGVFVPIVSLPIIGSVNYFNNGRGDGVIILVLVAISVLLTLLKRFHWLWTTGLASLVLIAYTFFSLQRRIGEMTRNIHGQLEGNPFRSG